MLDSLPGDLPAAGMCEWCGREGMYQVTFPEGCCSFFICQECVTDGMAAGGGTASSCSLCGTAGVIFAMKTRHTWWRDGWKLRHVTYYVHRSQIVADLSFCASCCPEYHVYRKGKCG